MVSPWAPWAVAALVVVAAAVGWFLVVRERRRGRRHRLVANSAYLYTLPSFRRRLNLHRFAALGLTMIVGGATVFTALLAGRPVDRYTTNERMATRDIVLCLDVSGSMISFDSQVLRVYSQMVDSFDGERIALNIWDFTSRQVFPLTDDYAMVKDELELGAEITSIGLFNWSATRGAIERYEEWMAGTYPPNATGSSLIGDGLASCVLAFDLDDEERSRTVILATDNESFGNSVFTLQEAAELAEERGVRIHAIYASEWPIASSRDEYEEVVTSRGGLFYELSDADAADAIVAEITSQDAVDLDATPRVIEVDRPDRYYPWLALLVGGLVIAAWRART
ncbi:MAG: VWA domain-containing protein [bacterium]|nr:VWA domain-containing protein [bacterium]